MNRRRPEGYRHLRPQDLADTLEADAIAALADARKICRRVLAGEEVWEDIIQELTDGELRALALTGIAGLLQVDAVKIARIFMLEEESCSVLQEALYGIQYESPKEGRRGEVPWERFHGSDIEEAAAFLSKHAGKPRVATARILADRKAAQRAYRRASKHLHPDNGGNTRLMQRLNEAKSTLDAHLN